VPCFEQRRQRIDFQVSCRNGNKTNPMREKEKAEVNTPLYRQKEKSKYHQETKL
jgi:hypothetical protein